MVKSRQDAEGQETMYEEERASWTRGTRGSKVMMLCNDKAQITLQKPCVQLSDKKNSIKNAKRKRKKKERGTGKRLHPAKQGATPCKQNIVGCGLREHNKVARGKQKGIYGGLTQTPTARWSVSLFRAGGIYEPEGSSESAESERSDVM